MLWIVLPRVATINAITALDVVHAIATLNVRIAIEVVIDVDVDVIASPTTTPAPTATPGRAHC